MAQLNKEILLALHKIINETKIEIDDFYHISFYSKQIIFQGHQSEKNMDKYRKWDELTQDESSGVYTLERKIKINDSIIFVKIHLA
jgi:hypothetical protein